MKPPTEADTKRKLANLVELLGGRGRRPNAAELDREARALHSRLGVSRAKMRELGKGVRVLAIVMGVVLLGAWLVSVLR